MDYIYYIFYFQYDHAITTRSILETFLPFFTADLHIP